MRAMAMVVLAAIAGSALAADSSPRDQRAIRAAKRAGVQTLDSSLPREEFSSWFRHIVGPEAKVSWEVNDCGEQTGSPADDPRYIPICAEARAQLAVDFSVTVSIAVGTVSRGVSGKPSLFWALVERHGKAHGASKLSDIPRLLNEPSARSPR